MAESDKGRLETIERQIRSWAIGGEKGTRCAAKMN